MDRVIKFRAWDITCRLMLFADEPGYEAEDELGPDDPASTAYDLVDDYLTPCLIDMKYKHEHGKLIDVKHHDYDHWHDRYTLMQYTGLKDKSGTPIFEGDIVKTISGIREIRWGFQSADGEAIGYAVYDVDDETEVIGNRFENPELLTKEAA